MKKTVIILSIIGIISAITATVIYFIKLGEELANSCDADYFNEKNAFKTDWE